MHISYHRSRYHFMHFAGITQNQLNVTFSHFISHISVGRQKEESLHSFSHGVKGNDKYQFQYHDMALLLYSIHILMKLFFKF